MKVLHPHIIGDWTPKNSDWLLEVKPHVRPKAGWGLSSKHKTLFQAVEAWTRVADAYNNKYKARIIQYSTGTIYRCIIPKR